MKTFNKLLKSSFKTDVIFLRNSISKCKQDKKKLIIQTEA